ncbi:hypothetical protein [Pseudomonas sp. CGJS7]|uniref:hypothetical protein n=1 Tax=Pseudomonas sp. CGJS7 TaxID=3109348 RepID=UPI003008CADB
MGCDIHIYLERRDETGSYVEIPDMPTNYPLGTRIYTRFAFLADVRNSFNIVPISSPRGLPYDISPKVLHESEGCEGLDHDYSWLSIDELLSFDYDQPLRFREGGRGPGCTAATYRELLDDDFLPEVRQLQALGATRLVFWFDN